MLVDSLTLMRKFKIWCGGGFWVLCRAVIVIDMGNVPARTEEQAQRTPLGNVLLLGFCAVVVAGAILPGCDFFSHGSVMGRINSPKARRWKVEQDCERIYRGARMINIQSACSPESWPKGWPESIEEMVDAKDDNGDPVAGGLDEYPKDPWGRDYDYLLGTDGPIVVCLGRDGLPGGEDEDADYVYPEEPAEP